MARWNGNILMHSWFNQPECEVGELIANTNKTKPHAYVFVVDTVDDTYYRHYYERPTAEEALEGFLRWQNAW